MKEHSTSPDVTSRLNFTKAILTTLATAPMAATALSCRTETGPKATDKEALVAGPKQTNCASNSTLVEDHIPPLEIDGGGSLHLEIKNKLQNSGVTKVYKEESSLPSNQRFGNLLMVRVLTETTTKPYVTYYEYSGFPDGSQLWVWYLDIQGSTGSGDDCQFGGLQTDPDVKILGGAGHGNVFSI